MFELCVSVHMGMCGWMKYKDLGVGCLKTHFGGLVCVRKKWVCSGEWKEKTLTWPFLLVRIFNRVEYFMEEMAAAAPSRFGRGKVLKLDFLVLLFIGTLLIHFWGLDCGKMEKIWIFFSCWTMNTLLHLSNLTCVWLQCKQEKERGKILYYVII